MKASTLFTAVAALAFTGSALAADIGGAAATSASAAVAAAANSSIAATSLNVPAVTIGNPALGRAAVHAEAVEFVRNYKTALAVQLEQYKN
jgi:hypothetical protein